MPANQIFKLGTRELLPATRDAYLRNALVPADARAIEQVLETDSVERGVTLARYHELAQLAALPSTPQWVRRQLRRQPSVSAWGPLRRPVLRLALGLLLLLSGFSVVQWIRNRPLVPVPVVMAFERTVNSAAQSLGRPVVYTPAEIAANLVPKKPAPVTPFRAVKMPRPNGRAARAFTHELASQPIAAVPIIVPTAAGAADSLGRSPESSPAPTAPAEPHLVRGRVYDQLGRPLAGATVLVRGTTQAVATDATGGYELAAPNGAILEIGYAGYHDETAQPGQAAAIDVTLQPLSRRERRKLREE